MMGAFHLKAAVFYAASLAVFAGAKPILPSESSNVIPDSPDGNEAPSENPRQRSVVRIDVSIEPAWRSNWVLFSKDREINVLAGEKIVEQALPKHLYAKYFESTPTQNLQFHGEGIADLRYSKGSGSSLEIGPLKPGTHHFGYTIKEDDGSQRRNDWTVHSVSSQVIQRNSLFEFKPDFPRTLIPKDVSVTHVNNIGVEVKPEKGGLIIHGLANDIQDRSILVIRMRHSDSQVTTRKVRLLLEEPKSPKKLCVNKNKPCVSHIQLWLKNFDSTIWNRRRLAKCVRDGMTSGDSELFGVRFEEYGTDATFFEAQPSDLYTCSYLGAVVGFIVEKCRPQEIIGYRLICGPSKNKDGEIVDKKMVELKPPAPQILQTTPEISQEMNTIDAGTSEHVSTSSESPSIPTTTERPQPVEISPKPQETVSEASSTESPEQDGTISTPASTSPEPPSTKSSEQVGTSSTTSQAPLEPSSTGNLESVGTSSTPSSTPSEPSTTVGSVPVKDESTTTKAVLESSSTIGPVSTEFSTTASGDESSTTPSVPTSASPGAPIVTTGSVAGGDLGTTEVGPAIKSSVASYTSVADHLYSYAVCLGVIFVVMFILIVCMSR